MPSETEIFYQITTYYAPDYAAGIRWNDPDIAIQWPFAGEPIISERDAQLPLLAELSDLDSTTSCLYSVTPRRARL